MGKKCINFDKLSKIFSCSPPLLNSINLLPISRYFSMHIKFWWRKKDTRKIYIKLPLNIIKKLLLIFSLPLCVTDIYVMPISTRQFIYEIKSPINLRGDIFVHFFQVHNKSRQTELISSIQFHTCAITRNEIDFYKNDIAFPHSGKCN